MRESLSQSRAQWQRMHADWESVQEQWHDSTTRYFERNFWEPLDQELIAYNRALDNLADVMDEINYLVD